MAILEATPKYLIIFLALVAFNGSLLTHGRQIKPLNQHSSLNEATHVMPMQGDDESFGDLSGDTNAFRPTTPGNSPGVGHRKFAQEDKDMKATVAVHSPDVKVYVTEGTTNGFKPTDPGHSPGVGHAQQNQIGQ